MAIPAGEAGKVLKSSERVQSVADALSTPRIRKAVQVIERDHEGGSGGGRASVRVVQ